MNATVRAVGASILALLGGGTHGAQTTLGSTQAEACYEAATFGGGVQDVDTCTDAINQGDLSRADLSATYSNRGIMWVKRDRLDRALEDQNTAIELNPDSARAHINRANVHFRQKRYTEALADYDVAVELSAGKISNVFYNRALTHRALGDVPAARADLERAIELSPNNATYAQALASLK